MKIIAEDDSVTHTTHNGDSYRWVLTRAIKTGPNDILPSGFPILVDEFTGEVCEPALLFLYEEYVQNSGRAVVPNTLLAYAHDLKEWWRYLEEFKLTWTAARPENLEAFLSAMEGTISPETGKSYTTATINRRGTTIDQFYIWGRRAKLFALDTPLEGLLKEAQDSVANNVRKPRNHRKRRKRADEKQHVSVMERVQAKAVMNALGPLPSEWLHQYSETRKSSGSNLVRLLAANGSARDRLAAEIALNVGLRISEVWGLRTKQFNAFPTELSVTGHYTVKVVGKGRKSRSTNFPGWLVQEIRSYIACERALTIKTVGGKENDYLLINPASSGRRGGCHTSVRTLERAFAAACISSGHYELNKITKITYEPGNSGLQYIDAHIEQPLFVFHDLRHTFAVWTYYARKRAGDNEPWLYIQAQLGHEQLQTTLETYLSATREFEASVSDEYMRAING